MDRMRIIFNTSIFITFNFNNTTNKNISFHLTKKKQIREKRKNQINKKKKKKPTV